MPDDVVYSVAREKNGIIWLGTDASGVVRFDEALWTGVPELMKTNSIALFPTIFQNSIKIVSENEAITSMEIYNVAGALLRQNPLSLSKNTLPQIDLSSLAPGIYFVSIKSDNSSLTKKIVKLN